MTLESARPHDPSNLTAPAAAQFALVAKPRSARGQIDIHTNFVIARSAFTRPRRIGLPRDLGEEVTYTQVTAPRRKEKLVEFAGLQPFPW